jgi:hypothetical protein
VERYEALRAQVLGGEPSGWRLGLALFRGRGMAGWLRACREVAAIPIPRLAKPSAAGERLDSDDLVGVLATMALAVVG